MNYLEHQKQKEIHIQNKIKIVKFGLYQVLLFFYSIIIFYLNKIEKQCIINYADSEMM